MIKERWEKKLHRKRGQKKEGLRGRVLGCNKTKRWECQRGTREVGWRLGSVVAKKVNRKDCM